MMFLPAEAEELLIHQHHTTVLPTCSMHILIFFVHVMLSCMKVLVKLLVQHLIVDEDLALPQLCIVNLWIYSVLLSCRNFKCNVLNNPTNTNNSYIAKY